MTDLFGRGVYSDEALWRARFDGAVAEARFWRNFAFLRPFGVPRSPEPVHPFASLPMRVAADQTIEIPHQRTHHPAVPELTQRALRNSNHGGRA